jgi:hypothetical protein
MPNITGKLSCKFRPAIGIARQENGIDPADHPVKPARFCLGKVKQA